MTYSAYEQSARAGSPVELFEFSDGTTTWRYAAYDQDYTWGGNTWTATAIGRGRLQQSGKIDQAGLDLRLPRTNELAARVLAGIAEAVISLTVWRGHADDPDQEFIATWKGRVIGAIANGAEITISCESIFTSMRRQGLRRHWQKSCPHVLYGRGCNLTQSTYAEGPFAIGSISGATVTMPDATSQPDGWYTGGLLVAEGVTRYIMAHTGDTLTLSMDARPVADAVAAAGYGNNYGNAYGGVPATLYPGCDRSLATCQSKFSNELNFGGWPYIPSKNPLGGSSIV